MTTPTVTPDAQDTQDTPKSFHAEGWKDVKIKNQEKMLEYARGLNQDLIHANEVFSSKIPEYLNKICALEVELILLRAENRQLKVQLQGKGQEGEALVKSVLP